MEETQKTSQGYSLFSRYKWPELVKEKDGVNIALNLMMKRKPNVTELREESIENGRRIRKTYVDRRAKLEKLYEDKQCSAKNRFDTTPTYSY